MGETFLFLILLWIITGGVCGAVIAYYKEAAHQGCLLGVLFGPLGVIAAAFLDFRPQCMTCGQRLNRINGKQPRICPHCMAPQPPM